MKRIWLEAGEVDCGGLRLFGAMRGNLREFWGNGRYWILDWKDALATAYPHIPFRSDNLSEVQPRLNGIPGFWPS